MGIARLARRVGEIERGHLPRIFAERKARGTLFATVCTGAMFLAAAGIARGRSMTTHAAAKSALANQATIAHGA